MAINKGWGRQNQMGKETLKEAVLSLQTIERNLSSSQYVSIHSNHSFLSDKACVWTEHRSNTVDLLLQSKGHLSSVWCSVYSNCPCLRLKPLWKEYSQISLSETNLLMTLILFGKIRKTEVLLENTNPSGGEIAAINRVVCEKKSGWI